MKLPILLQYFLLVTLPSIPPHALAQSDQESDALYALKAIFNDPFLNSNWIGPRCDKKWLPQLWQGIQCENGRVNEINLEGMGLTGTIDTGALKVFSELTVLNFRNNSIAGNVMDFSSNKKMKLVDLSSNRFSGPIPRSLLDLNLLESLQLQANNLSGSIPEFDQSSLSAFNVSYNNLSGAIPATPTLQRFGSDSFSNNSELCGPPTLNICNGQKETANNTSSDTHKSSSKNSPFPIMFMLFDIVGLVAVILLFILYFKKSRNLKEMLKQHGKTKDKTEDDNGDDYYDHEDDLGESSKSVRSMEPRGKEVVVGEEQRKLIFLDDQGAFELQDLLKAAAEGLGKGIFGTSYKAMVEGRPPVVVKRLRDLKPLSIEEFTKLLQIIADHKHPNLLPLLAYYYSKDEKLLVYKYADKGNLLSRIHGPRGRGRIPFRWNSRLAVARAVARALEYLHSNTKTQGIVPHGNLKSSNVLLDEDEMILVSDYGLASLIAQPIAVQRLASYQSPEFLTSKKVSRKSDTWSYGCILLELLTGRVSAHSAPPGIHGVDLCSWVHRAVREEWTAEIFDTEISARRNATPGMLRLLQIAIRCCEKSPDNRPEMTEVVREVENIKFLSSSEDEADLSFDQSLSDESMSMASSATMADER